MEVRTPKLPMVVVALVVITLAPIQNIDAVATEKALLVES